jgi:hypothetical protein
MQVEDLDGNVLRLGSEPKENEPFGEWLDMNGRVWAARGWLKNQRITTFTQQTDCCWWFELGAGLIATRRTPCRKANP